METLKPTSAESFKDLSKFRTQLGHVNVLCATSFYTNEISMKSDIIVKCEIKTLFSFVQPFGLSAFQSIVMATEFLLEFSLENSTLWFLHATRKSQCIFM